MNKVELVGRLAKDPEVKMTSTQTPYCNFTVAVDRKFKDANGERQADFISCVAWRQTATFIGKYFHKGNRIGLTGSIQTRNYEDSNGQKRYVTEVVIDDAEFVESSSRSGDNSGSGNYQRNQDRSSSSSSFTPPAQGAATAEGPAAPRSPIDMDESDDGFGADGNSNLPFEI
ncbi:MAG: single-stranded DNA-binding protein [Saccharofermentans sp.]|jgi:single-strand DNA-binding protein|nr:single-stranded DNA-binding protein [Mageeibacillus sp.]MCI1264526.1 single-stranded DNA-binding protein [Saccharofermentans sp.]MCI1274675.1 single-stranded DNA-binding protein [Saccharofermentans sp.]MCI1769310.1 single-stranded DNA-binding protein [Mageeibacillus sp.]MCI2044557.1 single-stranded DNA-binding protein [Mageeibacillus sp.]